MTYLYVQKMASILQLCLLLILFLQQAYSVEINATFNLAMSWDDETARLTHKILADVDGSGPVDLSHLITHDGSLRIQASGRVKRFAGVKRKKKPPEEGDYVRHGRACIKKQKEELAKEKSGRKMMKAGHMTHIALMVTEGEVARMTCHFCYGGASRKQEKKKKKKDKKKKSKLWYRLFHDDRKKSRFKLKEVKMDTHWDKLRNRRYVTKAHTLIIKRITVMDTGTYFCVDSTKKSNVLRGRMTKKKIAFLLEGRDKNFKFMFHLNVIRVNDPREVKLVTTDINVTSSFPSAAPEVEVVDLNVKVFTSWEEWSPCSVCDAVGTRRRLGLCRVGKIDPHEESKPWYLDTFLNIYADGILCRSSIFNKNSKLLNFAHRPYDEVEEVQCKVSCKNFKFDMMKYLASQQTFKTVKIKLFILKEGTKAELKCPDAPVDMPVAWINGSTVLFRLYLQKQADQRVIIDSNNTLHINPVELTDAGHYMCVMAHKVKGRMLVGVEPIPPGVKTWRYAYYLICTYPFDFAAFLLFLYVRHKERKKVLNYDLLPEQDSDSDEGSSVSDINVNRND